VLDVLARGEAGRRFALTAEKPDETDHSELLLDIYRS
jgi:hypothetical protein